MGAQLTAVLAYAILQRAPMRSARLSCGLQRGTVQQGMLLRYAVITRYFG
jgi:hypothetical protein